MPWLERRSSAWGWWTPSSESDKRLWHPTKWGSAKTPRGVDKHARTRSQHSSWGEWGKWRRYTLHEGRMWVIMGWWRFICCRGSSSKQGLLNRQNLGKVPFMATLLKGRFIVLFKVPFSYFQTLRGALTLWGNHLTQYNLT